MEMNQTTTQQPATVFGWQGRPHSLPQSPGRMVELLQKLSQPLYVLDIKGNLVLEEEGVPVKGEAHAVRCLGMVNPCLPDMLGSREFCRDYGVKSAYYAGAMANGINSVDMVLAMGRAGLLSAFGSGGLSAECVAQAIDRLSEGLPQGPFAINLLHNPGNPNWEIQCIRHCLDKGVSVVEASAYINLSAAIVLYRAAGLKRDSEGSIQATNRVIAKVSRPEVARQFLMPAPRKLLDKLLAAKLINAEQHQWAQQVPMADDITVESDSGGHTDHGVLACIFTEIRAERDLIQAQYRFGRTTRIGAAGGLGTPDAVYAAFALGADYVVTGSINQACLEAGTSAVVKDLLKKACVSDMVSAPCADMFELGAKVQVLKNNSMYGVRAQKLYQLYKTHADIDALPDKELQILEKQYFQRPIEQVWQETRDFFQSRGMSEQIAVAEKQPKRKMSLIFQWYLGQSSKWAIEGVAERQVDYQIWCGPAMGACNRWLADSELMMQRSCVDLAVNLMVGAAYLARLNQLRQLGVSPSAELQHVPARPLSQLQTFWSAEEQSVQSSEIAAADRQDFNQRDQVTMNNSNANNSSLDLTRSKEYYKKTWELLPGGAHYNFADPERALVIPFNKGRGARVWDLDGNEHLDLFSKFGALFVGHHNPNYNQALMKYMEKVTSVDTCDLELDVCETLAHHIPCAEMVRFSLSGTEAVQNALRLARAYTGKNRFVRFHGHYHGNSDNVMGGRKKKDLEWPTPEMFRGDMLDTQGRARDILEQQSFMLPWNDINALETVLSEHHSDIAAVLMEPICMNGGGILPCKGYLEKSKALCEKYNVVLIFDEIITGVRLGLGGAQKILGVTPHLSTFAKALGGGSMPISAIAGHKDLMNLYTRGKVIHAGTFNGYPLGLAAIKATYEIVEQDPTCYDRMGGIMAKISQSFIRAAREVGLPMVVQGMPTALVYHSQEHLVDRSEGYTDRVKFCDIIIREVAKRHGLQFSPLSRLYPNLMINEDDVTFFESRIYDAMSSAKKMIDVTFNEEVSA
ncbi:PfaD family polyunsaturated fatty acid/polyketide biosynthesis protein [Nitrincola sp. MINF-07-Sa-05]|uniref:PfaD family polyunsaturated fatty acid/polyketide biosynthesis protein n=1 Tax=Nitrincola salilacus TaxID=3400273 RepID=UPI0039183606